MSTPAEQAAANGEKYVITIRRQWHHPNIEVAVTRSGIGVVMQMPDFLKALAYELGAPAMLLTHKGAVKMLTEASSRVIEGAKEETRKVV